MFLILDVNNPAINKINPWPKENKNSIKIDIPIFLPMAAKAIIPAKIGVEQGVPAIANVIPKRTGYRNIELFLLTGIAFIIEGISKSRNPNSFNPIISSSDAIIKVKYPPKAEAKTLPVIAQIIPIIEKTIAVPKIKQSICKKVLNGVSSEHPPTYPIISGSIAIEQGDTDAKTPPIKDEASRIYHTCAGLENAFAILFIYLFPYIIFKYFGLD